MGSTSGDVASVCVSNRKGKGVSGAADPAEPYDVGHTGHELGHLFGANHTFNTTNPERFQSAAFEPGSGTTLMSYAGLPAGDPNDIQAVRDPYFHVHSLQEVLDYVTVGNGTCATPTPTGNAPPAVTAGPSFVVPARTPFALTASGTDSDADTLYYAWEEYDLGPESPPNGDADGNARPLFRSYPPGLETPQRLFPSLPYILDFANTPPESDERGKLIAESLPTISRTMTFRVTVRDRPLPGGAGAIAVDETQVVIDGGSGPFAVTAPNGSEVWPHGVSHEVTWDPAGSAASPVSCATVQIALSTQGGDDGFPQVLAASTPNDGQETVNVPDTSTQRARIRIGCVGNIFFDISDREFTLNAAPEITCPADLALSTEAGQCAARATFAPVVTDDQPDPVVSCSPPSGSWFPRGKTEVTCTATDVHGASDTCSFEIKVTDDEPPAISGLAPDPALLWPPNHKMISVAIAYSATDNCDTTPELTCALSVASDEPIEGTGDGDMAPDWLLVDAHNVTLRAERSGLGDGRVYTVGAACTDTSGNSTTGTTLVSVPHSAP